MSQKWGSNFEEIGFWHKAKFEIFCENVHKHSRLYSDMLHNKPDALLYFMLWIMSIKFYALKSNLLLHTKLIKSKPKRDGGGLREERERYEREREG